MKSLTDHNNDVLNVQRQIKTYINMHPDTKLSIKRNRYEYHCNHSLDYKKNANLIDISALNDIVTIDKEQSIALIEPLITMKSCCVKLLQQGFTLPVVPELPGITLGGAVIGLGGESSSHRYGAVHDCCVAYEVLLGDGTLLRVDADNEYSDLFYALPGSYGTLALIVGVWIKIIPAQPFVLLNVHRDTNNTAYINSLQNSLGKFEFVEGISYANNFSATIYGDMITEKPSNVPFYSMQHYWCPWYYRYVEKSIKHQADAKFYMRLIDYYFRHNKSVFWLLRYKTSDCLLKRYLMGWLYDLEIVRRQSAKKSVEEKEQQRIIQDVVVPFSNLEKMLNELAQLVNIYPLWFMPIINKHNPCFFWSNAVAKEDYFCDIGVYGKYAVANVDYVDINRELEQKTQSLQGIKVLFARCYYTEDQFWSIFNRKQYNKIRNKYLADKYFHDIYKKIST